MRKYEKQVANLLDELGYEWEFEGVKFKSPAKVPGQSCLECGAPMIKMETYTPDFGVNGLLYNDFTEHYERNNCVIEVKGGNITRQSIPRIKRFWKAHRGSVNYVMAFRTNCRIPHLKGKPTVREWTKRYGIPCVIGLTELKDYLS